MLGEIMPGFWNNHERISVSNIATSKFAILLYFTSLKIKKIKNKIQLILKNLKQYIKLLQVIGLRFLDKSQAKKAQLFLRKRNKK